ncbi:hypothetical protein B0H10DRAFT_1912362 [Mycena sp. CBHHK59/15]|nr:hypothetical protein B0H10DRAFT_1912362 [Mycena sp. CBHHK59/15]
MAPLPVSPDQASNVTSGLTSVLACLIPLLALLYIGGMLWALDYAHRNPNPLNKATGVASRRRRYAPFAYTFAFMTSLVVIAIPSWILLQYSLRRNYPNVEAQIGMRLALFAACWTCTTTGMFTIFFIHPAWSRHPISSIGTYSIWILLTWMFWVATAAVLNAAMPQLFSGETCQHLVYCGHIRAVFVFSIIQIATFTAGMATMMWLAWRCARDI